MELTRPGLIPSSSCAKEGMWTRASDVDACLSAGAAWSRVPRRLRCNAQEMARKASGANVSQGFSVQPYKV
jgi:hypothetical protein